MAKIVIDELVTIIGFKTTKESTRAVESVQNGIRQLQKLAVIATGTLGLLAAAMTRVAGGFDKQVKFARSIGLSVENLQQLQFAAQKAGVSADEMDSFLETLATTMTSTIPGKYNQTLAQLGVAASEAGGKARPLVPAILDIANALNKMDAAQRLQFTKQLGGSASIANLLGEDPKKITQDMQEAINTGAVVPSQFAANAAELMDDSLLRVKSTIKGLSNVLLLSFAPNLSAVLDDFDKWITKNEKIISSDLGKFIKGLAKGFSDYGKVLLQVLDIIGGLIKKINFFDDSLDNTNTIATVVTASLLGLTAAFVALAAPVAEVAIPIAALAGGFAVLIKKFSGIIKLAKAIKDFFISLGAPIDKTKKSITEMTSALERLLAIMKDINPLKLIGDLPGDLNKLASMAANELNKVSEKFKGGDAAKKGNSIADGSGSILKLVTDKNQLNGFASALRSSQNNYLSAPSKAASQNNRTTNNNTITIHVSGAGNPSAVAKEVKTQFDISQAVQTASPGYNRPPVA